MTTYHIKRWTLEEYSIDDTFSVDIADSPNEDKYFSISSESDIEFETYITKDKLRGLAVFILNYLENSK